MIVPQSKMCFNPCCGGSITGGADSFYNSSYSKGFNPCCGGSITGGPSGGHKCDIENVSILVVVDQLLEVSYTCCIRL